MAAGRISQSRDKVAVARVFYRGKKPPLPIGPSLSYRTFPNVCPSPLPAQRWGHFWEKCQIVDHFGTIVVRVSLDCRRSQQRFRTAGS